MGHFPRALWVLTLTHGWRMLVNLGPTILIAPRSGVLWTLVVLELELRALLSLHRLSMHELSLGLKQLLNLVLLAHTRRL